MRERKAKDGTKIFVLSDWKDELIYRVGETVKIAFGECYRNSEIWKFHLLSGDRILTFYNFCFQFG